jgi:hypothetical protein
MFGLWMCAWRKVRLQARACSHPPEFPPTTWLITTNIHLKVILQNVSRAAHKNLKKIVYRSPCSYKGFCSTSVFSGWVLTRFQLSYIGHACALNYRPVSFDACSYWLGHCDISCL